MPVGVSNPPGSAVEEPPRQSGATLHRPAPPGPTSLPKVRAKPPLAACAGTAASARRSTVHSAIRGTCAPSHVAPRESSSVFGRHVEGEHLLGVDARVGDAGVEEL